MGILSGIKKQLLDVIEWNDMAPDAIFYKWDNAEIKKNSRLILRPGQDAIFLYQGRVEGIFTAEGEYDVESKIIPFLSTLKGFKFGFDSGLRAEVLFVNTREFTVPWGTQNPINLPVMQLPGGMPIRSYGIAVCRIRDYSALVETVAGVQTRYNVSDLKTRISAVNDALLMKWITKEGKDIFNIQANSTEIGNGIKGELAEKLEEIGITCTDYQIQSVSYPDSVREMQEKVAGNAMVGNNMDTYTKVAFADSMENGKGTGEMAGNMAGITMGMVMGKQMVDAMTGAQPNNQPNSQPNNPADVAVPAGNFKFCPECGTPCEGMNFCPNCGKKLG